MWYVLLFDFCWAVVGLVWLVILFSITFADYLTRPGGGPSIAG